MATIPYQQLVDLGACASQRRKFKRIFGTEVTVTLKNLMPHASAFSFYWAINHLLRLKENKRAACAARERALSAYWNGPPTGQYDDVSRATAKAFILAYKQENRK